MTNKTYTHPDVPSIFTKNPFKAVGETAVITLKQGKTTKISLIFRP